MDLRTESPGPEPVVTVARLSSKLLSLPMRLRRTVTVAVTDRAVPAVLPKRRPQMRPACQAAPAAGHPDLQIPTGMMAQKDP